VDQDQFLQVLSVEEARRRWHEALDLAPGPAVPVGLAEAHGRVLGSDVVAPGDVPAFDRSDVDGYALRAADTFGASERLPARLRLAGPTLAAGRASDREVGAGEALPIATGGVLPRGADAVAMVEETEAAAGTVLVFRPCVPGARISAAGSDVGSGETLLRRGTVLTARETGTLAACGIASVPCLPRPRVAILSTGDELVAPGEALAPGQVHDANATLLADSVRELGGEPHVLGIARDEERAIEEALSAARRDYDVTLLSGGTSKGGGDLSFRVLGRHARIVVHGVALKPGKPLCLGEWDRRPVAVLPGFPTSAIFTFHAFVAPVLRRLAGRDDERTARVTARVPRALRSEAGRREFNLVNLIEGRDGLLAFPLGKGSGSVTTFARADGFFAVPEAREQVDAGEEVEVTLLGREVEPAELLVVGSHCTGLDLVLSRLPRAHRVKVVACGSRGGIDAAAQGACDLAPIHLLDPATGRWNVPFAPPGTRVETGYARNQGLAFRLADAGDFEEGSVEEAFRRAAREGRRLANRNLASGTRVLIDGLLSPPGEPALSPPGSETGYRTHTAVAAAIAQGRADFGICLEQAARGAGLGFRAWRAEHYDFLVPEERASRPAVVRFFETLRAPETREALRAAGFLP